MVKTIEEAMQRLKERAENAGYNSRDGIHPAEKEHDCNECKDLGGFIIEKDGKEFWRDCKCIQIKHTEKLLKTSEITEEFRKKGFGSFKTEGKPDVIHHMYTAARDYYMNFDDIRTERKNSIALHGSPGSGKTHLLLAVANNLITKKNVAVLYFPYVEGFNDLKDDFDKLEEKTARMKHVDVLFIDDLFKPARGKARATDWQVEQMYAVINHRYLNHLPIMISSELSVDEICEIDEALGTRIYEMSKEYNVLAEGDRWKMNHRLEGDE